MYYEVIYREHFCGYPQSAQFDSLQEAEDFARDRMSFGLFDELRKWRMFNGSYECERMCVEEQ